MLLTEEHWQIIEKLMGRKTPDTEKKKQNLLSSLLVRKRSSSSAKGIARNLQQWACRKISEAIDLPCGKDEQIASREMGQSGPDVRLTDHVRKFFPFTIECKSGNSWNVASAIKQAKANLYDGTNWMVILDRPHIQEDKRIQPIVIVDGEVFFKIYVRAFKRKG